MTLDPRHRLRRSPVMPCPPPEAAVRVPKGVDRKPPGTLLRKASHIDGGDPTFCGGWRARPVDAVRRMTRTERRPPPPWWSPGYDRGIRLSRTTLDTSPNSVSGDPSPLMDSRNSHLPNSWGARAGRIYLPGMREPDPLDIRLRGEGATVKQRRRVGLTWVPSGLRTRDRGVICIHPVPQWTVEPPGGIYLPGVREPDPLASRLRPFTQVRKPWEGIDSSRNRCSTPLRGRDVPGVFLRLRSDWVTPGPPRSLRPQGSSRRQRSQINRLEPTQFMALARIFQ